MFVWYKLVPVSVSQIVKTPCELLASTSPPQGVRHTAHGIVDGCSTFSIVFTIPLCKHLILAK